MRRQTPLHLTFGLTCLFLISIANTVVAQSSVGDLFGKLIGPDVDPVIKRAAGEIILEGVRRGWENGKSKPQPSPQPVPQPIPQPGTIIESGYRERVIVPSESTIPPQPPRVTPPKNQIQTRLVAPRNPSAIEVSMNHVIVDGQRNNDRVLRRESSTIALEMDNSLTAYLSRAGGPPELIRDYQSLVSGEMAENGRTEFLDSRPESIDRLTAANEFRVIATLADQLDRLAALPYGTRHQDELQSINQIRQGFAALAGEIVSGRELAIWAQRVKNMHNMALIGELAKVMGTSRRSDLFEQVHLASKKSEAPLEALTALLGMPVIAGSHTVGAMKLPQGNPSVVLYNPMESGGAISFVCDDQLNIQLGPGELVPFDQEFVVAFDNGAGSTRRYSISKGLYCWSTESGAWDLRHRRQVEISISAVGVPVAFHYLLNGQPQTIAPGTTVVHKLDSPPRIDFNTGKQGATKSSLITPNAYRVGVNAKTGQWDVFKPFDTVEVTETANSVARDFWRRSIARSLTSEGSISGQPTVDAILNAIE